MGVERVLYLLRERLTQPPSVAGEAIEWKEIRLVGANERLGCFVRRQYEPPATPPPTSPPAPGTKALKKQSAFWDKWDKMIDAEFDKGTRPHRGAFSARVACAPQGCLAAPPSTSPSRAHCRRALMLVAQTGFKRTKQ